MVTVQGQDKADAPLLYLTLLVSPPLADTKNDDIEEAILVHTNSQSKRTKPYKAIGILSTCCTCHPWPLELLLLLAARLTIHQLAPLILHFTASIQAAPVLLHYPSRCCLGNTGHHHAQP